MDDIDTKCKQERSLTVHRCPLCRIGMDIDYHYPLQYMWCDDCRARVLRYWKPKNF